MTRVAALPLSVLAATLLVACGSPGPDRTAAAAPPVQSQEIPYEPGVGVVQWVRPAPTASAGATAAADRTAGAPTQAPGAQRLAVRMESGRVQYVDVAGERIPRAGERVQLTPDRQIIVQ